MNTPTRFSSKKNTDFITSRRYDFGLQPEHHDSVLKCNCTKTLDPNADDFDKTHYMSCPWARRRGVTLRHDQQTHLFAAQARRAGGIASIEHRPDVDYKSDDKQPKKIRPDSMIILNRGTIMTDTVISNPCSATNLKVSTASLWPGKANDAAAKRKHAKYDDLAKELGATLMPLASETYGRVHPSVKCFYEYLYEEAVDNHIVEDSNGAKSRYLNNLYQELSVCLHKGNAGVIIQHTSKIRVKIAQDRLKANKAAKRAARREAQRRRAN